MNALKKFTRINFILEKFLQCSNSAHFRGSGNVQNQTGKTAPGKTRQNPAEPGVHTKQNPAKPGVQFLVGTRQFPAIPGNSRQFPAKPGTHFLHVLLVYHTPLPFYPFGFVRFGIPYSDTRRHFFLRFYIPAPWLAVAKTALVRGRLVGGWRNGGWQSIFSAINKAWVQIKHGLALWSSVSDPCHPTPMPY